MMSNLTKSSARTTIEVAEAAEIARRVRQGDPDSLSRESMERLLGDSALVLDGLRRRPRYFDGRFLTGADLTRDQDYIRQRQADLARASGSGVVTGLEVRLGSDPAGQILIIEAGHGVTPDGDIVMVVRDRNVTVLDLPGIERLDATLGLRRSPRVPLGRRTGLFVLALRSVEFTANPVAAYPTSVGGTRYIEDGDVIEATSITLIPFPETGGAASLEEARRIVARSIFTGGAHGIPQDALPLAMIAMERGAIRWIDQAMVRRETGADTPLQVSMGARPRALAEAFFLQHQQHLHDVLADRATAGLPAAFAAAQYFAALPAAGQLPASAILTDPMGFRQLWFPPAVDVEISFVPSDEIAALVEESLALPPIDLMGEAEDLDATGVVVLAPVTRQRLQRFESALSALSRATLPDPGQGIRRAPADMLAAMLARRTKLIEANVRDAGAVARAEAVEAETRAWQAAWADAVSAIPGAEGAPRLLWYVRKRAIADRARIVGVAVPIGGDDERLVEDVDTRVNEIGLRDRLIAIRNAATPFADARLTSFLGSPRIARSDVLLAGAIRDLTDAVPVLPVGPEREPVAPVDRPGLEPIPRLGAFRPGIERLALARNVLRRAVVRRDGQPPKLSEADITDVASEYGDPRIGDGIDRIKDRLEEPIGREGEVWAGLTGLALAIDRAGRDVELADFPAFAKNVREAIAAKDEPALKRLIGIEG